MPTNNVDNLNSKRAKALPTQSDTVKAKGRKKVDARTHVIKVNEKKVDTHEKRMKVKEIVKKIRSLL